MNEHKIIERAKPSLSFIEQLQNQIELCREGLSNPELHITPRVEALEGLLWAKLKDDKEYLERKKQLDEWISNKKKELSEKSVNKETYRINEFVPFSRKRARELFKAIMVFIDKKGYMPIGEENE